MLNMKAEIISIGSEILQGEIIDTDSAYLAGRLTLAQAIAGTKQQTRRFVHRQYTWYQLDDPSILWLQADAHAFERARDAVAAFLSA